MTRKACLRARHTVLGVGQKRSAPTESV
ncbi:MAG: hypothetical protein QOF51_3467, partial [Chloroflexota bacterium]|nr:hypothetical protein [Chloroflexota bacterium]